MFTYKIFTGAILLLLVPIPIKNALPESSQRSNQIKSSNSDVTKKMVQSPRTDSPRWRKPLSSEQRRVKPNKASGTNPPMTILGKGCHSVWGLTHRHAIKKIGNHSTRTLYFFKKAFLEKKPYRPVNILPTLSKIYDWVTVEWSFQLHLPWLPFRIQSLLWQSNHPPVSGRKLEAGSGPNHARAILWTFAKHLTASPMTACLQNCKHTGYQSIIVVCLHAIYQKGVNVWNWEIRIEAGWKY